MMETPPFRLARSLSVNPADTCCQPAQASLRASRRRVRLAELDSHLHCSIIGTCLTTSELRKLVPKFADIDRQHASDLEIHHTAVELAMADGAGSKALHKALDERYAGAIRRFDQARDPEAVLATLGRGAQERRHFAGVLGADDASASDDRSAAGGVRRTAHAVASGRRGESRGHPAARRARKGERGAKDKVERQQGRLHEMAVERDAALRT